MNLILLCLRCCGLGPPLGSYFFFLILPLYVCQYALEISFSLPMNDQTLFLNEIWKHHGENSAGSESIYFKQSLGRQASPFLWSPQAGLPLMSDSAGCTVPNVILNS